MVDSPRESTTTFFVAVRLGLTQPSIDKHIWVNGRVIVAESQPLRASRPSILWLGRFEDDLSGFVFAAPPCPGEDLIVRCELHGRRLLLDMGTVLDVKPIPCSPGSFSVRTLFPDANGDAEFKDDPEDELIVLVRTP